MKEDNLITLRLSGKLTFAHDPTYMDHPGMHTSILQNDKVICGKLIINSHNKQSDATGIQQSYQGGPLFQPHQETSNCRVLSQLQHSDEMGSIILTPPVSFIVDLILYGKTSRRL